MHPSGHCSRCHRTLSLPEQVYGHKCMGGEFVPPLGETWSREPPPQPTEKIILREGAGSPLAWMILGACIPIIGGLLFALLAKAVL